MSGALLLCRAEPAEVRPAAQLLHERMVLAPAGDDWSVLVPEGRAWQSGSEPVDRVLTGWVTALAVSAKQPVLALWWDRDRAGYILASGFRRPVGYVWLADGTPAGEDEAMRTFAARLGLDPVLDMAALEDLARPDVQADARARLLGLIAVLTRGGLSLPTGLTPGDPADHLHQEAVVQPGASRLEPRHAVPAPDLRLLSAAEVAVGIPLLAWALVRRNPGWTCAGALLIAHGALAMAYGRLSASR
ncbi:hypothetical protein GCM10020367_43310 [Streptomyces sannanensis]|uniref:Uncharacterized protein n=1 Tax=Streptomyces sannanensis TaxID=285536 RepID=A0ABP6SFP5_9ACTN